jgi:hypothetical protein
MAQVKRNMVEVTNPVSSFPHQPLSTVPHNPASTDAAKERLSTGQQEEINVYEGELAAIKELAFAFQRASSRLVEMNSRQYYEKWKNLYLHAALDTVESN